jgi:pseudaminic acid synthase
MAKEIKIADFILSETGPVFIIAELSANHGGSLEIAETSIRAIKKAGADAVKVQTYRPDAMTLESDDEIFRTRDDSLWAGRRLYDLYREGALPYEWHETLKKKAEKMGLMFFSTPFDLDGVDFLEDLQVPAYKIASLEITDIPLITHIAKQGKPILISTGIAEVEDIRLAVDACLKQGNDQIILLKCTSSYPTPPEDAHLNNITWMKKEFNFITGISDHTTDIYAPVAAVTLGARVVEKHFILDKSIKGLDAAFSLNAREFSEMVRAIRTTEKLLGEQDYTVTAKMKHARISSRSVFVTVNMRQGDYFTHENIKVLRPGYGLHPKYYDEIIGKKASKDLTYGTPLTWEDITS